MFPNIHETADGHEINFQVNYLAPFLLTTQLMELLVDSRATVVNTSSSSHKLLHRVTIADFETTDQRRPSIAYALRSWQLSCSPGNYIGETTPTACRLRWSTPATSTPTSARHRDHGYFTSCATRR